MKTFLIKPRVLEPERNSTRKGGRHAQLKLQIMEKKQKSSTVMTPEKFALNKTKPLVNAYRLRPKQSCFKPCLK
jgi:hypothetical protein